MKKTKFIKIPTIERLPEIGTHIVQDYEGQLLISRYGNRSTEEFFHSNYQYWLLEVEDIEEQLIDTLKSAYNELENTINTLSNVKEKLEYYQQKIKETRNE